MFKPFFTCLLYILSFVISGFSQSFSVTTITANPSQIVAGEWTVTVPIPESTTIEIDIQTQFNRYHSVTVVGPTTFVSVVRIRTITSQVASGTGFQGTAGHNASSTAPSSTFSAASSVRMSKDPSDIASTKLPSAGMPPSRMPSAAFTSGAPYQNSSSSIYVKPILPGPVTAAPGAMGMDPDSVMAAMYAAADKNASHNISTWTTYTPAAIAWKDECVLWDPLCSGNKTLAALKFFNGTMNNLLLDPCFGTDHESTNCTSSKLDPASSSMSAAVKSWMRQPACPSSKVWFESSVDTKLLTTTTTTMYSYDDPMPVTWPWGETTTLPKGPATVTASGPLQTDCCGQCMIYGPNVDVYFWPQEGADDSCLGVVGSNVAPKLEGAQTDHNGVVYWADTTHPYDIYQGTHTTARIITINGIEVKEPLQNPWGDGSTSPPITTTRPVTAVKRAPPITSIPRINVHARAHSLLKRKPLNMNNSSITQKSAALNNLNASHAANTSVLASTLVSNGFTFTSPSVYVAFYSLSATDQCGYRGIGSISSTMLAFAPGELSTVEGHMYTAIPKPSNTKSFNFADLPCPPKSVMEADWYKPAPGEPYRPLLALPDKVRSIDQWWIDCTDSFYFTGLDPPKALGPATAMVMSVTAVEPTRIPEPSPAKGPVAKDPATAGMVPNPGSTAKPTPQSMASPQPEVTGFTPQTSAAAGQSPANALPTVSIANAGGSKPQTAPLAEGSPNANPLPPPAQSSVASGVEPLQPQVDPNSMSPGQLSALHQALVPAASPALNNPQPPAGAVQPEAQPQPQALPPSVGSNPGSGSNSVSNSGSSSGSNSGSSTGSGPANNPQLQQGAPQQNSPTQPGDSNPNQQLQPVSAGANKGTQPGISPSQPGQQQSSPNQQLQPVVAGFNPTSQPGNPPSQQGQQQNSPILPSGGSSPDTSYPNVAIGPANLMIGSSSYQLPQVTAQPAPLVGGQAIVPIAGEGYVVSGETLIPGGTPISIGGTQVQVNQQGAPIVGTRTYPPPQIGASSVIAGHTVIAGAAGHYQVDGINIAPGSPSVNVGDSSIQISNPIIGENLPSNSQSGAGGFSIGGANNAIQLPPAQAPSAVTTIGGQPIVVNNGAYQVQNMPIVAGSPPITVSGTQYSLSPSNSLVVGSQAYSLPLVSPTPNTVIAGQTVVPFPSGILINGQTLTPGAPAITISNSIPVSLGSSALVVGSSTVPVNPAAPPPSSTLQAGSQVLTALPSGNGYVVNGQTASPGSAAITVSGTPISLAPSGFSIVIGSSTIPLATNPSQRANSNPNVNDNNPLTANGQTFTPLGSTAVAISGTTLSVSGPAITDNRGSKISLGASGLVVGSSTFAFATPASNSIIVGSGPISSTFITTNGQTYTVGPSNIVAVGGSTLSAGGPGATISGTSVSVVSGALIVGSSTIPLPTAGPSQSSVITTNGQTFTFGPSSAVVISGSTLNRGGPGATISGMPISLASGGLVIGSTTIPLPTRSSDSSPSAPTSSGSSPSVITTDGQTLTVQPNGVVAIGGSTLSVGGPAATVSGTSISLASGGLVVGGSTVPLATGTGTLITSTGTARANGPTSSKGGLGSAAGRKVMGGWLWMVCGGLMGGLVVVV